MLMTGLGWGAEVDFAPLPSPLKLKNLIHAITLLDFLLSFFKPEIYGQGLVNSNET